MDIPNNITLNHQVNITVDNTALVKIALIQVGILLLGFILKAIFPK